MRRILGLNFRDKILDASIIDYRFRTAKPLKSEGLVLPENTEERDRFILDALKRWKKEYSPDGVVIGLPLQKFLCQLIDMPAMKRSDLRKALSFELEKYLPLPVDEFIFDFIPLERMPHPGFLTRLTTTKTEKDRVKVLVFSIKKDIIDALLRYVKGAGLDILSIRCSTISALSGFLDIAGEKNIKGLFVNITDDLCEIAGLKNSMPVFFKNLTGNIDLSDEIEKLLALNPGLVYFIGNPYLSLTKKFKSREFHVQVPNALAFSEVKKSWLDINFLPQEYAKESKDYYPYFLGGVSAAALMIFLFTGIIAYYKDLSTLKFIEAKISSIKNTASGVFEAQKKLDLLQNERKILLDFQNRSNIGIKVINNLSKLLPNDVWLTKISINDKGKVEIDGFAKKTSDLAIAIENSKTFKNVSFTSPIITRSGEKRFTIKMEVEGF